MTLVEVLVATGLGTVVLAAVMSMTVYSARSFAAVSNYVDMDMRSRHALDKMSQEIRQADGLTPNGFSATQLVFTGTDPMTTAPYTLTYTYDPARKTLTRSRGGESESLLTQCDSLVWSMYKRNMTNGTDEPIPTSDPRTCKLIKLDWVCSRSILGKSANTESVQSAEIVVRKK
jgi:Tfp pilus assembly protein PilV